MEYILENDRKKFYRKKKIGAIVCGILAVVFTALMLVMLITGVVFESEAFPVLIPHILILLITVIGLVCIVIQRLKEIKSGEEYDARNY